MMSNPEKTTAKKQLAPWLIIVMIAAVALSVVTVLRVQALKSDVAALQAQLDESQAAWQAIDAEKQAQQEKLIAVRNALREAQLTLDESVKKAEEMGVQIDELNAEKQALTDESELQKLLAAYTADAAAVTSSMQDALNAVKGELEGAQTELESTRSRLLTIQAEMVILQKSMQTIKDDAAKNAEALQAKLDDAEAQLAPLQEQLDAAKAAQKDALIMLQKHYQKSIDEAKAALASTEDNTAKETLTIRIETLESQCLTLQEQIDAL